MHQPPQIIQILLPVWGERYTQDFLELGLPSLLSPGNVPALSKLGRCTFVLLAPERDIRTVEQHALWQLLQQHCDVSVTVIDDLISQSSSTVLTLAYALAIRASEARALSTCFVPLVADYVFSDGALFAAVKRVFGGARAVLAGNFMVARERIVPMLATAKRPDGVLVIAARDFVGMSLRSLHQFTHDDIVVADRAVRAKANRLFWRVEDDCVIGRFYLMHMIALHPQTTDFMVGAPSDYSLVPELCPSGRIERLADSDDYFVVECQPQSSTSSDERVPPHTFAKALATWATAMHHINVQQPVVFHASGAPKELGNAVRLSEQFLAEVNLADVPPLPFRNHPMWARLVDYHIATAQVVQSPERLRGLTGDTGLIQRVEDAGRLRSLLLGRVPDVRPWHPRWQDVRLLKETVAELGGKVAVVSNAPARARAWLDANAKSSAGPLTHIRLSDVKPAGGRRMDIPVYDTILCCLDRLTVDLESSLAQLRALVRDGGRLLILIGPTLSEKESEPPLRLERELDRVPADLREVAATGVTRGACCAAAQSAMLRHARKSLQSGVSAAIGRFAVAAGLAAVSALFNVALVGRRSVDRDATFSSLLVTFRKANDGSGRGDSEGEVHLRLRSHQLGN